MRSTSKSLAILASALLMTSTGQVLGAGPATADECLTTTDRWQAVDLGVTGGALDINDLGQVAGFSRSATGETRAIVWDDGEIIDVGTLGGPRGYASGIDEEGHVVGNSYTESEKSHAFLWYQGTMQDLGLFGGYAAFPGDVDQGVIVGDYRTVSSDAYSRLRHAFVIRNGVKTDLDLVAGSEATAINTAGQIAGTHRRTERVGLPASRQTQRAFLWENGAVTELGTLGGIWSEASGLNNQGQVVGQLALDAGGVLQAGFVWDSETGMRRLEDGGGVARPKAINDGGVIVGTHTCASGTARAVVWTGPSQAPALLPDPAGGTATAGNAVNVHGEIAGNAIYPDGQQHAVLWRPVAGD
ncbi:hypothetical protein ACFPOI_34425 [Nonomuraea angiospora]|uniref:HAF family extracellular repeat protein n=1 Tax=Nonomuraea angiospora TaxID=46172 RepID=A0ABR9LTE6_9ACTN|nr:hypothetical protein [Nonomuraea angiospora]MBE1583941.1 putative HAF family extracellular repeat protein [Nonomuraea angiospora]